MSEIKSWPNGLDRLCSPLDYRPGTPARVRVGLKIATFCNCAFLQQLRSSRWSFVHCLAGGISSVQMARSLPSTWQVAGSPRVGFGVCLACRRPWVQVLASSGRAEKESFLKMLSCRWISVDSTAQVDQWSDSVGESSTLSHFISMPGVNSPAGFSAGPHTAGSGPSWA